MNADVLIQVPLRTSPPERPPPPASWLRGLAPFLDALREPVIEFDAAGRVEFVNRAFLALLGATATTDLPSSTVGQSCLRPSWLAETEHDRWQMFVELHHAGRADEFGIGAVVFTIERVGAPAIQCEFVGERLRSETGAVVGVVAVIHPLTEQQRGERRTFDELAAEVRRLSSAVRDLAGRDRADHSFARPQETILSLPDTELLHRGCQTPSSGQLAFVQAIHELSNRERAILRGLLEGKRTATIAKEFYLSEHTVRNHLKRIYRKAGVHSLGELRENLTPVADELLEAGERH